MHIGNMTNAELIRHVDNLRSASELERILTARLDALMRLDPVGENAYDPRPTGMTKPSTPRTVRANRG